MMKVGLAVSTYSNENTNQERIDIIKQCLDSLINIIDDVDVLIVNDCSLNKEHIKLINSYKNFTIINKLENGGIARSKNTAINHFKDYDYVFLMDDDVEILDKNFYKHYILAKIKTNIHHFCLQVEGGHHKAEEVLVKDYPIIKSDHTNGCFLMLTKEIIKEIGYFKILPFKYGHEHSNYTLRCIYNGFAPTFVDIVNSNKYLKLIDASLTIDSGVRFYGKEFDDNRHIALHNVKNEKHFEFND